VFRRQAEHFALLGSPVDGRIGRESDRFPSVNDEITAALAADGTIDITTIGARSGLPRRTEIWFLHFHGRTFITGTPGPRDWYANVRANGSLTFHLKKSVEADLEALAVPVHDESTRRWVLSQPHPWNDWYREQVAFEDLVAASPMVELFFAGDAA
jgi:deazaflavin-dependent oxidoreductase (nitroreductase family)